MVNRVLSHQQTLLLLLPSFRYRIGYNGMGNFYKMVKKHSLSQSHLQAVVSEKTFGKVRVDYLLDRQREIRHRQHNDTAAKNREIMRRIVDVVCFFI